MKSKRNAFIMDIDGVLCDSFKVEFIEQFKGGDFSMFERDIPNYPANNWCVELVNALSKTNTILFVTARDSKYREETISWLDKHLDTTNIYSRHLYMRPEGDTRSDHEIKRELHEEFRGRYNILAAIDDNWKNCKLWESLGITALTNVIGETV